MELDIQFKYHPKNLDNLLTPVSDYSEDSLLSYYSSLDNIEEEGEEEETTDELKYYFESNQEPTPTVTNSSTISNETIKRSEFTHSLSSKVTARPGKLLSLRTTLGLGEFTEFCESFVKNGWGLSKLDLVKSILFVKEYYSNHHTQ